QLVRYFPDGSKRRACVVERAQVRGIVMQIELVGSRRLDENLEHLGDESARERRIGPTRLLGRSRNGRKRHSGNVLSWLICATSLSPLPLTHKSPRWSGLHLPFCPSIHATAWAVSN